MTRAYRVAVAAGLTLACALATPFAVAEDAAAAPEVVAKPTCSRPEFPGRLASENQKRAFGKDVDAYAECVRQYVAAQQKAADEHMKAANAAAAEYNTAVKQIQAQIDEAKQ